MHYFNFKNIFDLEKKSVFLINLFLILIVIVYFMNNLSLKTFFYFDIILTFILSYIFFSRSRKLSKMVIVTNLFILFYFLYPQVSIFFTLIFRENSYLFILLYNVLIAYIFLLVSGKKKVFFGKLKNFNIKLFFISILIGLVFGLIFTLLKEPIPSMINSVFNEGLSNILFFLIGSGVVIAFSEQVIFTGFLYNIYSDLTSKFDAVFQVSIIFVMFHLLRFNQLVNAYKMNFGDLYLIQLSLYYVFLFIFMSVCIYFYSLNYKGYKGNFIYPVVIHFTTDLSLFIFTIFIFN